MTVSRRRFLTGSAALGAAGLAGVELPGRSGAESGEPEYRAGALADRIPFDGLHQSGVTDPLREQATVVALDAIAPDVTSLRSGLQQLSAQARALTAGYGFGTLDVDDPPEDSGTLGDPILPDQLTVTIGFGASLFDHRFGLASRRPVGLTTMPNFPGDELDPGRTGGDLLVVLNANRRDTVVHALRELMRPVRDALALRWAIDGFQSANRGPTERSSRRNLFGFRDGTANPTSDEVGPLVWLGPDAGSAAHGAFQVVRTIRMHVEFWDRVGLREQENMIGRYRVSGAPLDGATEFDVPDYAADPHGVTIPLDAHIRLANPRTAATAGQRLLRHAFNYARGFDSAGQLDQGLLFVAYNASNQAQFEVVNGRLATQPMNDYFNTVGGGYFFVPRGAAGGDDWVGSGLLGI